MLSRAKKQTFHQVHSWPHLGKARFFRGQRTSDYMPAFGICWRRMFYRLDAFLSPKQQRQSTELNKKIRKPIKQKYFKTQK